MTPRRHLYTPFVSRVLFPLHERLKGHRTHALLGGLEDSQHWPSERLERFRVLRLREFLEAVGRRVPHYRRVFADLRFDPTAVTNLADLQHLPLSDKGLIRAHTADLKATDADGLVSQRTTGSTGEPLTFYVGRDRISHDVAARWRAIRWWGLDIGDPEVVVWGSSIELGVQNRLRTLRDRLLRSYLFPVADISPARLDRYLHEMRRIRPAMMFGYPSALAQLALRARARQLDMGHLGIRVAFVTSEVLQPQWQDIISHVFNCSVANEYGAREAGLLGRQCPNGGIHLSAEFIILETLDEQGRPSKPGCPGEVVVTNLASSDFPVLRYRTGDLATLDHHPCPCGRTLPLLKEINGRANDCLVATDGSLVHPTAFNYVIRGLDDVHAYKVIQDSSDAVRVFVVAGAGLTPDFARRIETRYKELLGSGMTVLIERVDDIPRDPSGKFRHVVNRIRGRGQDTAALSAR